MNSTTIDNYGNVLRWVLPQDIIDSTIRFEFIGTILQIALFGVCFAVFFLSPAFSSSSRGLRAFIVLVVLMDLVYTILRSKDLVSEAAAQDRDMAWLGSISLSMILISCISGAIIACVQIFFAIRVVKFLEHPHARRLWLGVFVIGVVISLVGWSGVMQLQISYFLGKHPALHPGYFGFLERYGGMMWFSSSALVDILISATLVHRLRRSIMGFNTRTDSVLWRLIRVTLATGCLTAVMAVVIAGMNVPTVMTGTQPSGTLAETIISFPLPSLYCLSVFWQLDLRHRMRQELRARDIEISLDLPTSSGTRHRSNSAPLPMPYDRQLGNAVSVVEPFRFFAHAPSLRSKRRIGEGNGPATAMVHEHGSCEHGTLSGIQSTTSEKR